MKYILSILLIAFLFGCSNPAGQTAKNIGRKVKECCTALSLPADKETMTHAAPVKEGTDPLSAFTISVFERSEQILTW